MDVGFNLDKLTFKVNDVLSPLIYNEMLMYLGTSVSWAYFSVRLFFSVQNICLENVLFTMAALFLTMIYTHKVLRKCNLAEIYLNSRASALEELQNNVYQKYAKFDRRLKWKIEILEERLSRENAYSPYYAFNLNRAAFLPSFASVITYFIIIVQFKISEVPTNSNTTSEAITILTNNTDLTLNM